MSPILAIFYPAEMAESSGNNIANIFSSAGLKIRWNRANPADFLNCRNIGNMVFIANI
jgi:hypothetical protein